VEATVANHILPMTLIAEGQAERMEDPEAAAAAHYSI